MVSSINKPKLENKHNKNSLTHINCFNGIAIAIRYKQKIALNCIQVGKAKDGMQLIWRVMWFEIYVTKAY